VHQLFICFKKAYDLVRLEVWCNIHIEFGIPIETSKANKMCLDETYSIVLVGKHLSNMLPIKNDFKQGDALSPFLFNFPLEYAIRRIQVNQDGLKLNCTHQLLVYADDVYLLHGSVHTIKKNTKALLFANTVTGLKINADKTKYMVLPQDQNAG
jgi:hypothetical protein